MNSVGESKDGPKKHHKMTTPATITAIACPYWAESPLSISICLELHRCILALITLLFSPSLCLHRAVRCEIESFQYRLSKLNGNQIVESIPCAIYTPAVFGGSGDD